MLFLRICLATATAAVEQSCYARACSHSSLMQQPAACRPKLSLSQKKRQAAQLLLQHIQQKWYLSAEPTESIRAERKGAYNIMAATAQDSMAPLRSGEGKKEEDREEESTLRDCAVASANAFWLT